MTGTEYLFTDIRSGQSCCIYGGQGDQRDDGYDDGDDADDQQPVSTVPQIVMYQTHETTMEHCGI